MSDVAICTANFGKFDEPRETFEQDIGVEWHYFTDDPDLEAPGWEVHVEKSNGLHPCLQAKKYRMDPPVPHRYVIWIDANMSVIDQTFVRQALECLNDGMAVFSHPRRICIYKEAVATRTTDYWPGKYDDQPIEEQVEHYREQGHPENWGLFAAGTILWDRHDERAVEVGRQWLEECHRWTYQDQLSLPVVCRRLGVQPGIFPLPQLEPYVAPQFGNRWLILHPHLR